MSTLHVPLSRSHSFAHPSKNQGGGDKPKVLAVATFALALSTGSRGGGSHIRSPCLVVLLLLVLGGSGVLGCCCSC